MERPNATDLSDRVLSQIEQTSVLRRAVLGTMIAFIASVPHGVGNIQIKGWSLLPKAEFIGSKARASGSRPRASVPVERTTPSRTALLAPGVTRSVDTILELAAHAEKRGANRGYRRRALAPASVTIQLDGTVSYWSRAAERLFGHAARSVLGQPLSSLLKTEIQNLTVVGDRGDVGETVELDGSMRDADAAERAVIIKAEPVRDETGTLVALDVRLRDVSQTGESVTRNLEMRRLRAMTDTAAGLAHDVNNLLMVVQSYAEFVSAGPLSLAQRDDLKFCVGCSSARRRAHPADARALSPARRSGNRM